MGPKVKNELAQSIDIPMTMTNRLLLQFDFSGVDVYTMDFARIACTNYKPSTSGARLFNYCLTNLPVYVAADEKLQFGWSENSIYRNYAIHLYEYEHLLLAAALSECLPEAYAAAVLKCLGDKYEDEDRINPPLDSWRMMVRSVNGLITRATDFALIIDDRMQLDPYRVASGHSTSCTNSLIAPAQFATAFKALADLSVTGEGELTLAGGNFLGWYVNFQWVGFNHMANLTRFAAFAELFLGIDVQVSSRDGEVLFETKFDSKARLKLIFVEDIDNLTPTVQALDSKFTALTLMCRPDAEANTIPRVPFTGRVVFESLLPRVFENSFHMIAHQESKFLVQSIGGVARLFECFAEDPNLPEDVISKENRLNKASLGMGLIQTICNWFPELRHLQGRLERLQTLSLEGAGEKCESGARGLVGLCGCTICSLVPLYADKDPGTLPQSFCLMAIMETILNLGLALSRVTVVPKLYPSRAGIMCLYQRQVQKLLIAKRDFPTAGDSDRVDGNRVKTLFSNDWNAGYSRRLQNAVAIFSGSWPQINLPDNLIALSHEGICAHATDLRRVSSRKEDAGLIQILTGHLYWKQKIYDRACLGYPSGVSDEDYSWELTPCSHLSRELYCK